MEEIILLFEDHALSLFVKKYIEECHQDTVISQMSLLDKYLDYCEQQLK